MLLYIFFQSGNYNCPLTHPILRTCWERDENQLDDAQVQTYRHELQEKAFKEHNESKDERFLGWIRGVQEIKRLVLISSIPRRTITFQKSDPRTLLPLLFLPQVPCLHDAFEYRTWPYCTIHLLGNHGTPWGAQTKCIDSTSISQHKCLKEIVCLGAIIVTFILWDETYFCFQTLGRLELFWISKSLWDNSHFVQFAHFTMDHHFSHSLPFLS